jgi:hypothetical protein
MRLNSEDPTQPGTADSHPQATTVANTSSSFEDAGAMGVKGVELHSAAAAAQDPAIIYSQSGGQLFQPNYSFSRLTDVVNGVSPSKINYQRDFYPSCPSAVPSPLRHFPGQLLPSRQAGQGAGPTSPPQPVAGTLSDGSNILTHFYMANEHMDVLGRSLYDLIDAKQRDTVKNVETKYDNIVELLNQRVDDLKVDMVAASDQYQSVIAKLERLVEFIKTDIATPLSKVTSMSNDIKALQKTIQDLQKKMEHSKNPVTYTSPEVPCTFPPGLPLPNIRSQPSLTNFYGYNGHDAGHDGSRMPPPSQDTRYRFNSYGGYYRGHGSRENNGASQYGGGLGGGYGYYNGQAGQEQSFGYGSSAAK